MSVLLFLLKKFKNISVVLSPPSMRNNSETCSSAVAKDYDTICKLDISGGQYKTHERLGRADNIPCSVFNLLGKALRTAFPQIVRNLMCFQILLLFHQFSELLTTGGRIGALDPYGSNTVIVGLWVEMEQAEE
jgi:hypothetical protein